MSVGGQIQLCLGTSSSRHARIYNLHSGFLAHDTSWLRITWQRRDQHRHTTHLALIGVAIAAAMAVLGPPPVDLHGPFHQFGIMDPLCGGTRAASYTAQGEWAQAWKYNPLGIVTLVGAAAVTIRTLIGALLRRWLTGRIQLVVATP